MVMVGERRAYRFSLLCLLALTSTWNSIVRSVAHNIVKLILNCLFQRNLLQLHSLPVFAWFVSLVFAPSGMAVLSMSVQHFLGGLITTLTFTTMMHCTQRAEESIQVKLLYSYLPTASFWRPRLRLFNNLTLFPQCVFSVNCLILWFRLSPVA